MTNPYSPPVQGRGRVLWGMQPPLPLGEGCSSHPDGLHAGGTVTVVLLKGLRQLVRSEVQQGWPCLRAQCKILPSMSKEAAT
jgi:hypothetical protein